MMIAIQRSLSDYLFSLILISLVRDNYGFEQSTEENRDHIIHTANSTQSINQVQSLDS